MDRQTISLLSLEEIINGVRQAVREEMAAGATRNDNAVSNDRPINTKELCEYLNVTPPCISRWRAKGKIPFFQIGTSVRFNLSEVLKSLEKK